MIKEAIEKIVSMAPIERFNINGYEYASKPLMSVRPHEPYTQDPLKLSTLSGITGWLYSEDGKEPLDAGVVVHVRDYDMVEVFSLPDNHYRKRHQYLLSTSPTDKFSFNSFMSIEQFVISASSKFIMTEELQNVIKTVSNIKSSEVITVEDDGISQSVTAASAANFNRIGQVQLSPFVNLKPFRTFREIKQPESRFLLRIKQQKDSLPMIAIFEADNAEWKLEAMSRIASFLSENLTKRSANVEIIW